MVYCRILFVALTISIILSSCERCEQHFVLNKNMRLLAEAYQSGNWWIYVNQDSTKFDSVYVTDVMGWNYEPTTVTKCEVDELVGFFQLRGKYFNLGAEDELEWRWRISNAKNSSQCHVTFINLNGESEISTLITDQSDFYSFFLIGYMESETIIMSIL